MQGFLLLFLVAVLTSWNIFNFVSASSNIVMTLLTGQLGDC